MSHFEECKNPDCHNLVIREGQEYCDPCLTETSKPIKSILDEEIQCLWPDCDTMVNRFRGYCDDHYEMAIDEERRHEEEAAKLEKQERIRSLNAEREITFKNLPGWLHKIGFPKDIADDAWAGYDSWLENGGNTMTILDNVIRPWVNMPSVVGFLPAGLGLWLFGPEGCGKTGLGARVMVEMLRKNENLSPRDFSYVVWPDIWRSHAHNIDERTWNALDACVRRVIFLDEVLENVTEAQVIAMKASISAWKNKNCCVIIATNPKPSELEMAERGIMLGRAAPVTSRLRGMLKTVPMTGNDFRLRGVK